MNNSYSLQILKCGEPNPLNRNWKRNKLTYCLICILELYSVKVVNLQVPRNPARCGSLPNTSMSPCQVLHIYIRINSYLHCVECVHCSDDLLLSSSAATTTHCKRYNIKGATQKFSFHDCASVSMTLFSMVSPFS